MVSNTLVEVVGCSYFVQGNIAMFLSCYAIFDKLCFWYFNFIRFGIMKVGNKFSIDFDYFVGNVSYSLPTPHLSSVLSTHNFISTFQNRQPFHELVTCHWPCMAPNYQMQCLTFYCFACTLCAVLISTVWEQSSLFSNYNEEVLFLFVIIITISLVTKLSRCEIVYLYIHHFFVWE